MDNGENSVTESFKTVLFSTNNWKDQQQDDIWEGQSHLRDLGTDYRKILKKQEVNV
jgi:hypothetical protein